MHQHAKFANLIDVLAVDFDIVDGLRDSRKRDGQNHRKAILTLEGLALDKLTERDPFLAIDRPDRVNRCAGDGLHGAVGS